MKHVHVELIKAWADGAKIQYLYRNAHMGDPEIWCDVGDNCVWSRTTQYRIKPERVYPKSTLTKPKLSSIYTKLYATTGRADFIRHENSLQEVADAAIKQYIQEQEGVS